jgi:rhodanese-related sulfurtransferase
MLSRLLGFGSPKGGDRVHMVDPAQVRRWLEAGTAVLVDVREPDEHAAERIAGAVSLPLSVFDPTMVPRPVEGQMLVFHCRSGVRCGAAAERMLAAGWTGEIHRMQGGILGWKASGGPTVAGR